MDDEKRIGLAELISNLREELLQAQVEGDGQDIRFLVEDVELEVEVTSARKTTGEAGIKFWVVNAKAGGDISTEAVQKLKIKLKPQGPGGNVLVGDQDKRPTR